MECNACHYCYEEQGLCLDGAIIHNPSDNFECKYPTYPYQFICANVEPELCPVGKRWTVAPKYECEDCKGSSTSITYPYKVFEYVEDINGTTLTASIETENVQKTECF